MSFVINSFRKLLKRRSGGSFPTSSSRFFSSPAPGPSSVSGPLFVLCSPPASYPKARQMSLSAKKFGCQLISYRNLILGKALQFYPDFASNLNFSFNRGSPSSIPSLIFIFPKSPSSPIFLAFCYSKGIKNLIRRMHNGRSGILPVDPDNLPAYDAGGGGDFCIYEASWGESKAVAQVRGTNNEE